MVVEEEGEGRPCLLTRTIATIGRPISTEQTDEFFEKMIFFFFRNALVARGSDEEVCEVALRNTS